MIDQKGYRRHSERPEVFRGFQVSDRERAGFQDSEGFQKWGLTSAASASSDFTGLRLQGSSGISAMSFDHCSVEELFGPQAKGSDTIRFDRLTQEPMMVCPQGHSVALGRLPWQSACNKCPQHKGWQASDILRYYNSVLSMSPLPWHGSVKGKRSECSVAQFKGHALRFKKGSGRNWVVLSPSEAAAQKGKGGAPQAPPAGKGPQTVPPRGWLTQPEPEQTQPKTAQEKLLGSAQASMVQLPSA